MKANNWKSIGWIGGVLLLIAIVAIVWETQRGAAAETATDEAADPYHLVGNDEIDANSDALKAAGLRTVAIQTEDVPITLSLTARSGLNMENVTHVHAQFGGKVKEVAPELGTQVKGPGTPGGPTVLCVIESNDLAQAKSNYLQAKVQLKLDQDNLDRTRVLVKSTVLAEKFLLDATSAVTKDAAVLEAARQQLLVFGLNQKDIDQIDTQEGRQRMDYIITSPRSGVIAEKGVAGGEIADPTVNLFTVADTSTMWVWGDVYERDLRRLKLGEPVKIVFTSDPGHVRECKVDWISPVLDPNTHSIRVRGVLENTDGRLLADMYGTMRVTVDPGNNAIVIPADCVVRKGTDEFVFVQSGESDGVVKFKRVPVKTEPVDLGFGISESSIADTSHPADSSDGDATKQMIRVVDGLSPGQLVVQSGALGLFNEMQSQAK
jgi:cobalt-zinc-cadmium efflux system membrane fusion protein